MPRPASQPALNQLKFDFARQPDSDALCQRLLLAYLAAGKAEEAWNTYQTHSAHLAQSGTPLSEAMQETAVFLQAARISGGRPKRSLRLPGLWIAGAVLGTALLCQPLRRPAPQPAPQKAPVVSLSTRLSENEVRAPLANRLLFAGAEAYHRGEYLMALSLEYGGLALSEEWADQEGQGQALTGLGQVYQAQGDLKRADECYRRAWELRQNHPDPLVRANLLELRAGLNRLIGKTEESKTQLLECLRLREQHQDRGGVAAACLNLAEVALTRGELAEAERWQQRALQEAEALNLKPLRAAIWMSQARLALLRKDTARAREKAEAGRTYWQAQKHPRWIAAGLLLSSRIANASGQAANAETLAAGSQRAYEAVGDRYGTMQAVLQRVLALRLQQRSADSLPLLEEVRNYARENEAVLLTAGLDSSDADRWQGITLQPLDSAKPPQ